MLQLKRFDLVNTDSLIGPKKEGPRVGRSQGTGGSVEVGLRLPNGDAVYITSGSPKSGFFWLPPAPRWLPGVGVIVGPSLGCDVNSTYEAISEVAHLSRTGTDPLPSS